MVKGKPALAAKSSKPAKNFDTPGSNGSRNGDRITGSQKASRMPAPMPVPLAHSANGRARKNLAGLTSRELDHFRDLLFSKRRELIGDMSSMEREALRSGGGGSNLSNLPIHMADMGTDNYEQEFTLGLVQKERDLLKEINLALAKIQNGNFGVCEGTGLPIIKERLEYQPWARYSVEHRAASWSVTYVDRTSISCTRTLHPAFSHATLRTALCCRLALFSAHGGGGRRGRSVVQDLRFRRPQC